MELIDLGKEVEYIEIEPEKIPYSFSAKLFDRTYDFTVLYNEQGGFFTVDLGITATGETLCYGEVLRYGRPLFGSIEDERYPIPVIIPLSLTGDEVTEITKDNFGRDVKLYLYERRC